MLERSQLSGDLTFSEIKEPPQTGKEKIMILGNSMIKKL